MSRKLAWKRISNLVTATGDDAARQAAGLRDEFGDGFASFLLGDKGKPSLTEDMLVVLFARKGAVGGAEPAHPLRESLLLPLFWKEGVSHSRLLPQGLLEVADKVCADKAVTNLSEKQDNNNPVQWGLHPCFRVDISDWDEIAETWDSAWGILAAGLYMKRERLRLKPGVFVSAAWNGHGIQEVGSVPEKFRAAREAGASMLFLAARKNEELQRLAEEDKGFVVSYLHSNMKLKASFAELLYRLEVPPQLDDSDPASYERCVEYAQRIARLGVLREMTNEYVLQNIVPTKAASLRQEGNIDGIDVLVVLVSQVPAAFLSFSVFKPKRVLFLASSRDKEDMNKFFSSPEITGHAECSILEIRYGNSEEAEKAVREGLKGTGRKAVVDVTGLDKSASIVAAWAAEKAGAALVAIQTSNSERGGGYVPGAEKIIWIKREH